METTKKIVVWSKKNKSGNTLEISADPEGQTVEFWVDGSRKYSCSILAKGLLFRPTTSPETFQVGTSKYGVNKFDKAEIDKIIAVAKEEAQELRKQWALERDAAMAEYPGLKQAIARYGTFDRADAAEDVFAADLLRQWENR